MLSALVLLLHLAAPPQSPSRPKPVTASELEKLAQQSAAEKDWDTAADEFRRAADLDPRSSRLLIELGQALAKAEDFPGAIDAFQSALKLNPHDSIARNDLADARANLAKLALSKGDLAKAQESMQQARDVHPDNLDYLYIWGKILEKQNRTEVALQTFEKITQTNPKEARAFFEIGAIRQQQGNRQQARQAYKKALELSPENPDYRKALDSVSGN